MKTRSPSSAFSLVEVLLAVVILGLAGMSLARALSTISIGRLRTQLNREVVQWQHNYALGLARGDIEASATTISAAAYHTYTLPSGITVTVTNQFSAQEPTMPSLLFIQTTATWAIPGGAGTASATTTVARSGSITIF